jgi:hypothetical protein
MRFFGFKWFGQSNPSRLLINVLKYFRFWFQIRQDIWLCVRSTFSQCIYRCVLCILRIQTNSFCVFLQTYSFRIFSVYKQRNFVWKFTSFHVFSVYVQILSPGSTYTYRFIPSILSKCTDSFSIFRECNQIIFNIQNGIFVFAALKGILLKKKYVCLQLDQRPTRNYRLFGNSLTKKFFPRILIIRGMTFDFEYLGEFKFIFKYNLGQESGDQELDFHEKKRMSKISCKCTFKHYSIIAKTPGHILRYFIMF